MEIKKPCQIPSSKYSEEESYSFEICPWQGDSLLFEAHDFCECPRAENDSVTYLCDQCGRPSQPCLFQQKRQVQRRSTGQMLKEEKINSNEVPKHRIKRLFNLQNNYISESEGVIVQSTTKGLNLIAQDDDIKKRPIKSNIFTLLQDRITIKPSFNTNKSRMMRNSSQNMS